MYQPILTIAIPTFNRALLLDKCFGSILSQIDDDIKKDIELIVLNNDSHDNTDEIVSKYIDKGFLINYDKHPENIGADRNIAACFLKAKGKYVWIFSDDDFILPGYLPYIVELLKNNDLGNVYVNGLWYSGSYEPVGDLPTKLNYEKYENPISFVEKVNYWSTFITGNILNKSLYQNADSIDEFYDSCLVHLSWTLQIIFGGKSNAVINDQVLACRQSNSGGYKLLHVFGKNLNDIIDKLTLRKLVDGKIKRIINQHLLKSFFPMFISSGNNFEKENRLKILLPVYWRYRLFWTNIFPKIVKHYIK